MARSTECFFEGGRITVDKAIGLRDKNSKNIKFQCIECGERVRPHQKSKYAVAHFEHLSRNPKCTLSDPAR